MDDDLLNRIASLERKALQASHQQAQQHGQHAPPAAGFQQQQARQAAPPPQQQQQQQAPQTSGPAPLAGQLLPQLLPSSDGPHSEWGSAVAVCANRVPSRAC